MILGPGLEEGDKARSFDEAIACQSTELNLSGNMHSNQYHIKCMNLHFNQKHPLARYLRRAYTLMYERYLQFTFNNHIFIEMESSSILGDFNYDSIIKLIIT